MKRIRYKRSFYCDKSIAPGIKWLNKNGFYTCGSCSGVNLDHKNQERDTLYIEFEKLSNSEHSHLTVIGRKVGFNIKKRENRLRLDSNAINRLWMFYELIKGLDIKGDFLNVRTMGISNWVKDEKNKKLYSVQFYDFDFDSDFITKTELERIRDIFPYDCLMYETKHGIQFISFALLHGLRYTKTKAIETSKDLGKQDYWTEAKDLTLRIAPKWKQNRFKKRQIISKKPKFRGIIKNPTDYIISEKHLEFYLKFMNLPQWVYDKYGHCDKRDYKIKLYHYKTRD